MSAGILRRIYFDNTRYHIMGMLRGKLDAVCDTVIMALIARFMGPSWGPTGADRTQVDPMLAPWTLLSGGDCEGDVEHIPKIMHIGGALLWFAVVLYNPFYPYLSGLLYGHWGNHMIAQWGNHMIAPVPVKQLWRIWVLQNITFLNLHQKRHAHVIYRYVHEPFI